MYDHIVIPVAPGHAKDSDPAVETARKLLATGGKLSVISVVEETPMYLQTYIPGDLTEKTIEAATQELDACFNDSDVGHHVVLGKPASAILGWVENHAADAIVLTSHRPGVSDYFLGSTASKVVRQATCPVMVLR